jgi:putative nucleotidyltransferase with HDIG domain
LVLAQSAFNQFAPAKGTKFDLEQLWSHSLATATGARALAVLEGWSAAKIEEAYLAGILHDIGKVVLASRPDDPAAAPEDLAGAEHAEAGAYLLGLWGFSDTVVEAIALYHTPAKSAEIGFGLPGLLHVADQLALEVDPRGHEAEAGGLDMDYLASLELAPRVDSWREAWPRTGLDPGAAS